LSVFGANTLPPKHEDKLKHAGAQSRAEGANLTDVLGAWNPINLNDDQPSGDVDVLVARENGEVGLYSASTVRSLKRAAVLENDACVFAYWMPVPKAPNV
jgi:hypothetical protein